MGRMLTNNHPATTLIVKSATLAQAQSADKTCDWMTIGVWQEGWGGGGEGKGRGRSYCYLLFDEPLSAGDVITQHH